MMIGNMKKAARPRRPPTIILGQRPVIFVSSQAQNFITACQSRSTTTILINQSNSSTSNLAMPDWSRHPPQGFNCPPGKLTRQAIPCPCGSGELMHRSSIVTGVQLTGGHVPGSCGKTRWPRSSPCHTNNGSVLRVDFDNVVLGVAKEQ